MGLCCLQAVGKDRSRDIPPSLGRQLPLGTSISLCFENVDEINLVRGKVWEHTAGAGGTLATWTQTYLSCCGGLGLNSGLCPHAYRECSAFSIVLFVACIHCSNALALQVAQRKPSDGFECDVDLSDLVKNSPLVALGKGVLGLYEQTPLLSPHI